MHGADYLAVGICFDYNLLKMVEDGTRTFFWSDVWLDGGVVRGTKGCLI